MGKGAVFISYKYFLNFLKRMCVFCNEVSVTAHMNWCTGEDTSQGLKPQSHKQPPNDCYNSVIVAQFWEGPLFLVDLILIILLMEASVCVIMIYISFYFNYIMDEIWQL